MDNLLLENRVSELEGLLGNYIVQTTVSNKRLTKSVEIFKNEMTDFKNEMTDFKNEMSDFKNEMSDFKDEMSDFKDEMSDFKDEMGKFKNEVRADQISMNKKWGDLANKWGTLAEDLAAPSVPRLINEKFGIVIIKQLVRASSYIGANGTKETKEYDVITITEPYVFLTYIKTKLNQRDTEYFAEDIADFKRFFPEYAGKKIIGIIGALSINESQLNQIEKSGFLAIAPGSDVMDILNSPDFKPKEWE